MESSDDDQQQPPQSPPPPSLTDLLALSFNDEDDTTEHQARLANIILSQRRTPMLDEHEEAKRGQSGGDATSAASRTTIVPSAKRLELYTWLLFRSATPPHATHTSFKEFRGTMQRSAAMASLESDVEMAVANVLAQSSFSAKSSAGREDLRDELCGLVECLCAKTSTPYSPAITDLLTVLMRAASEMHSEPETAAAESASSASASISTSSPPQSPTSQAAILGRAAIQNNLGRIFSALYALTQNFLPRRLKPAEHALFSELMRLLLQYHDPALSLHLDRQKLNLMDAIWPLTTAASTTTPAVGWAASLYRSVCPDLDTTLMLWDGLIACFATADRGAGGGGGALSALVPLIAVQLLKESRDILLAASGAAEVRRVLQNMQLPLLSAAASSSDASAGEQRLREERIGDFWAATLMLQKRTPFATRSLLQSLLFGPGASPASDAVVDTASHQRPVRIAGPSDPVLDLANVEATLEKLRSFVALPISSAELIEQFAAPQDDIASNDDPRALRGLARRPHVNYIVLDCRAEKSFMFARLPTAIHVGGDIGFDPELLNRMVARFESARGSHICVLGTGRDMVEEANLLKIIALQFVGKGFPYVGIADGGFRACIPHIKAGRIEVVRTPLDEDEPSTAAATAKRGGSVESQGPGNTPSKEPTAATADGQAAEEAEGQKGGGRFMSDETKDRLEHNAKEIKKKASEGVQAAKSWGLGLVGKLGSWGGKKKEDAAPAQESSSSSAPVAPRHADPSAAAADSTDATKPPMDCSNDPPQSPPGEGQLFSFLDDDDDDLMKLPPAPQGTGQPSPQRAGEGDDDDGGAMPKSVEEIVKATATAAAKQQHREEQSNSIQAMATETQAAKPRSPTERAKPGQEETTSAIDDKKLIDARKDVFDELDFLDSDDDDKKAKEGSVLPASTKRNDDAEESTTNAAKEGEALCDEKATPTAAAPTAAESGSGGSKPHPFDDLFDDD